MVGLKLIHVDKETPLYLSQWTPITFNEAYHPYDGHYGNPELNGFWEVDYTQRHYESFIVNKVLIHDILLTNSENIFV